MPAAVFLDRDDTLIANRDVTATTPHPGDLFDPDLVRLLPGAAAACARLKNAGFLLVVVSNQGCVARGLCTTAAVEACNRRMRDLLMVESQTDLDAIYYCPYHPKGTAPPWNTEHPWRKPQPGMLLEAARDLNLDLTSSWMVGDSTRDLAAAAAAGIPANQSVLVGPDPEAGFPSLAPAAEWILRSAPAARP